MRRHYFELLHIRNVYNGFIILSSFLEASGIRVPVRNIRDLHNNFYTSVSRNKCPSVRCALAANEMCDNVNMSGNSVFNINILVILLICTDSYPVVVGSTSQHSLHLPIS
jgi:hypothetical protein